MTDGDLSNMLVVTSIGSVQILDGTFPPTDAYELGLLNLGNGEELTVPVSNEQAEAIFSLYVSALGTDDEAAEVPSPAQAAASEAWETEGRNNKNSPKPTGTGDISSQVLEL
jgi:hypothetical protein